MFWTYNKKFQPHRSAGVAQPNPINTLNQQSPKNLINANWTSVMGQNTFLEVSSTYFHMHWPSTWSDEFNALAGERSSTRRRSTSAPASTSTDRSRPASASATRTGSRPTSALTRYIDGFLGASHQLKTGFENWWTPTGTDGFNVFDDVRLRYTGAGGAPATRRSGPAARRWRCSSTTRR